MASSENKEEAVCVTGGNGFIGSWLVKTLLEQGYTRIHVSIYPGSDASHLFTLPGASSATLTVFEADILDAEAVARAVENCRGVFHVASPCTLEDPKDRSPNLRLWRKWSQKLMGQLYIVQLWKRVLEKTKTNVPKKTPDGSKSVLNSIPAGQVSRKSTNVKPLKDISNMAASLKSTIASEPKPIKSLSVGAKNKIDVTMDKSPFPIKCDFANSSSDSHPFVSMDAHFGHSPLDETDIETDFIPVDLPNHGFMNDKAECTAEVEATLVDDLSSYDEEDMVTS